MIGAFILLVLPIGFTLCLLWAVIEEILASKRLPMQMIGWTFSMAVLSSLCLYFFEF